MFRFLVTMIYRIFVFIFLTESISEELGERLKITDEASMKKVRDAIGNIAEEPS